MNSTVSQDAIYSQRSELKFEVDESTAQGIRQYLHGRLKPDPNCFNGPYEVCSVYLDSPSELLYHQTNHGIRNRYKLRIRIYDNDPANPAFMEIKRRDGSSILKQRATVTREVAQDVLAGKEAVPPISAGASDWKAFQEFVRLRDSIGALGTTYVFYKREAYVSPHNSSWRATFDRNLIAYPYSPETPLELPLNGVEAHKENSVVFEFKFTHRYPDWMEGLVRTFGLIAGPFPKYITCRDRIQRIGAGRN